MDRATRLHQDSSWHSVILLDFANSPLAKNPDHARIGLYMAEAHIKEHEGEVYALSDEVLGCVVTDKGKDTLNPALRAVYNLRPIEQWAPFTKGDSEKPFKTTIDLKVSFLAFENTMTAIRARAHKEERLKAAMRLKAKAEEEKNEELEKDGETDEIKYLGFSPAVQLEFIESQLEELKFLTMLRSQPICKLGRGSKLESVFGQEFYTSVAEIQKTFSTQIRMSENYLLLRHLSRSFDCRSLRLLQKGEILEDAGRVHMNLTLDSLETNAFKLVEEGSSEAMRKSICFEINWIDALSDSQRFKEVANRLKSRGYNVLLDGLTIEAFYAVNLERLPVSMVKLNWAARNKGNKEARARVRQLSEAGIEVILSQCDSPSALLWGKTSGIDLFQGLALDGLVSDSFYDSCPDAKKLGCTIARCRGFHWSYHKIRNIACPRRQWTSPAN